jgi:drug/metabolite transporter (DMT)-like permease
LAYAGYVVLQRPLVARVSPLIVTAWAYAFGGAAVLLAVGSALLSLDVSAVPESTWWILAYVIVVPTTLNYALVSWAIKKSSPALVATYTTLQPVSAAVLAAMVLDEAVHYLEAVGFVLIVFGLFLVSRRTPVSA